MFSLLSFKGTRLRKIVALLLLIACVVLIAVLYGRPAILRAGLPGIDLSRTIQALKAQSLESWKDRLIAKEKLPRFGMSRLSMVIKGEAQVESAKVTGAKLRFTLHLEDPDRSSIGSAVVISRDGYLLTAAHCIEGTPILLLIKDNHQYVEMTRPRVVWQGDWKNPANPDLALLHIEHDFDYAFHVEADVELSPKTQVFTSGYGQYQEATSAGVIVQNKEAHTSPSGAKWTTFKHTAPLTMGDSGGPVFGLNGQLLGINCQSSTTAIRWRDSVFLWRQRSTSVSPDHAWLQDILKKDRLARSSSKTRPAAGGR